MNFSDKIFKLRKENGFSQEGLAEQLNTTRQAISKWENNQGLPETEKLVMIGDIFNVSIDYLLKERFEVGNKVQEQGYYVSKEMAEAYLEQERKIAKYVSLGLSLIALSFVPYFLFKENLIIYVLLMIILGAIGAVLIILGISTEQRKFRVLKEEPLQFDEMYYKELSTEYEVTKKKFIIPIVIALTLFISGLLVFMLEDKYITSGILFSYYPISVVMIAIGIYILIRMIPILDTYKLLVENDEYINKYSFKIKKKINNKFNEFLD